MKEDKNINIMMLSTGEEVLHGEINDTNATWLSKRFFESGFSLTARSTVGDHLEILASELIRLSRDFDIVIINGGLGPTTDDVTAEAMAKAMNVPLVLSKEWLSVMRTHYKKRAKPMAKSNIKQALIPQGFSIIPNKIGTACGFMGKFNRAYFYFTPGVPFEFKQMVDCDIIPHLRKLYSKEAKTKIVRFFTFGLSESWINDQLIQLPLSTGVTFGFRSALPFIEIKLISVDELIDNSWVIAHLKQILNDYLVSEDMDITPYIAQLLIQTQNTIAVAEKWTGGYFTYWLNQTPEMQLCLKCSWIINDDSNACLISSSINSQQPIERMLEIAKQCRIQANASIGLAIGERHGDDVVMAMSTEVGSFGVMIKPSGQLKTEHYIQYCAAFLLDLLRRYLTQKSMQPTLSNLMVTEFIFIPD